MITSKIISNTEEWTGRSGEKYVFEYSDADSFDILDSSLCRQVYAVCFCDNKMVIGCGPQKWNEDGWGLLGGGIEKGETFEETLKREIQEESNMKVLSYLPIGYQKVINTKDASYVYQLRYVCKVKPFGPFVSDPAGSITEIKLINPSEYKKYFNWGKIGERIISRAVELLPRI